MAAIRMLGLSVALWSIASPAWAGCTGSDDSGGSDDGGGWDDSGGDSCPMDWGVDDDNDGGARPARRRACVEVSDTVGESVCRRFGSRWDTSGSASLRFSIRPAFRVLRLDDVSFTGSTHHEGQNYQTGNGAHGLHDPSLFVGGATARLDVGFLDYFSAGVEVSILGAEARGPTRRDGEVSVTPRSLVAPSVGLIAGGALPVDIVTFRPELYLGYRVLSLQSQTRVGPCVDVGTATEGQALLEARLTTEVFVSPFVSLAATVGTNVLSPGEMLGVLSLSVHSRAFDGQPR